MMIMTEVTENDSSDSNVVVALLNKDERDSNAASKAVMLRQQSVPSKMVVMIMCH